MRIHFETSGEGPPLLFIPGLGTDLTCWDFQVPDLARGFQVIRVDNRGVGRSPAPPGPYTCQEMASDLVPVLDQLEVPAAVVIGHSMGAAVAAELALADPGRVAGLVLVGGTARLEARALAVLQSWLGWLQAGLSRDAFARSFLPWVLSRRFFESPLAVQEAVRLFVESPWPQGPEAYASQLAACRAFDTSARLDRIEAPTLVISGSEDLVTPPDQGRALAQAIPGARYVEMPGLAHACMGEGAAAFNALVRDFALERVAAGAFAG